MAEEEFVRPGFTEGMFHPAEITLLNNISHLLAIMVSRSGGQPPATAPSPNSARDTGATAQAAAPQSAPWSIQLPLKAIDLANMISAVSQPGYYTLELDKLDVNVPIGATVTVRLPPRPDRVMVATSDLGMTASFYSNLITMTLQVDGIQITTNDNPFTVTGGDSIPFGPFFHWNTTGLVLTLTNQSTTATLVSFRLAALAMNRNFWANYFVPLITGGFDVTKRLAESLNGRIRL